MLLYTPMQIRILLLNKVTGLCDSWPVDPPGLHFELSGLYFERPRLCYEPLKLLNFACNVDPDPAFLSNADQDQGSASQNSADPDPQPCYIYNLHSLNLA
jgi:hypothetical protein